MKRKLFTAALALAAPLALIATPGFTQSAQENFTGHIKGDRQAPTRLTQFVSYTCSHCGHFENQAWPILKMGYIQPGKLAVETRHIIRDPVDMAAVLLAECGPDEKFYGNHEAIFRNQDEFLTKARATTAEQRKRWISGTYAQRFQAIASDLDLYKILEPRGYSRSQLDQCLGDRAAMEKFAAQSARDGQTFKIEGTPSFAINGKMVADAYSWEDLKPKLDARLKDNQFK